MGLGGFQWEIWFCVKGISYLEFKTQLLTFWKDMVVHQSKYHLVLQNGLESKKVDGGDRGVHLPDNLLIKKLFFWTRHSVTARNFCRYSYLRPELSLVFSNASHSNARKKCCLGI